jgi:hypothetical protein
MRPGTWALYIKLHYTFDNQYFTCSQGVSDGALPVAGIYS